MRIVVFNLGCKVNQYECDVICDILKARGHIVSNELLEADVYIINTCAVTQEAEKKSRQSIARCKKFNPEAKIIVCGCASQNNGESFIKDGVKYISGTTGKIDVVNHIKDEDLTVNIREFTTEYEECSLHFPKRTRAYVKIQDGCNNFCSYCLIPYLRGRSRSRDLQNVIEEVKTLSENTDEIVLTGIDLMAYGKDNNTSLAELIRKLSDIDIRIRLGSVYAEKIDEELLDALFNLNHFCPQFHLSLQSGDSDVLKSMNRRYTADDYEKKIELIRRYDDNASITTDVIVGFPTESEAAFANTYDFLQDIEFSDIHVFPYSRRSGTTAAKMQTIPPDVMNVRKHKLLELKKELSESYHRRNIGKLQRVLIEEQVGDYMVGYSENYLKVYTKKQGNIVECYPTQLYKDGLLEE